MFLPSDCATRKKKACLPQEIDKRCPPATSTYNFEQRRRSMSAPKARRRKQYGVDVNRYLGIEHPDRIHSTVKAAAPSSPGLQCHGSSIPDSSPPTTARATHFTTACELRISRLSGTKTSVTAPRQADLQQSIMTNMTGKTTGLRRKNNKSNVDQTSISMPFIDRSNTQRTQRSTMTSNTGNTGNTSFLPELNSTPPMPTFQKPTPTGLRRPKQSDLHDENATPARGRKFEPIELDDMTATPTRGKTSTLSHPQRSANLKSPSAGGYGHGHGYSPHTSEKTAESPSLQDPASHASRQPANASTSRSGVATYGIPVDPSANQLPYYTGLPAQTVNVSAGRLPFNAYHSLSGSGNRLPSASSLSPAGPANNSLKLGRANDSPVLARARHVATTALKDRIGETPPLPAAWTPQHDKAICVLEFRGYTNEMIVSKIRETFREIQGILTPGMIEKRLRQLDQNVEIRYWQIAIEHLDKEREVKTRRSHCTLRLVPDLLPIASSSMTLQNLDDNEEGEREAREERERVSRPTCQ